MPISKKFTTVTKFSKAIAMILFLLLPFAGFYLGIQYQRNISPQTPDQPTIIESLFCTHWQTVCDPKYTDPNGGCAAKKVCIDQTSAPNKSTTISKPLNSGVTTPPEAACTQEAKLCPDGSYVGRSGPSCEFDPCTKLR